MGTLKEKQRAHWKKLFSSQFDEECARSVYRVGLRHRKIELGPAWYVAGYTILKMDIINLVILQNRMSMIQKGRWLKAAEKYIALDMAIALSAYDNTDGVLD